jgi:hypothetical protein
VSSPALVYESVGLPSENSDIKLKVHRQEAGLRITELTIGLTLQMHHSTQRTHPESIENPEHTNHEDHRENG